MYVSCYALSRLMADETKPLQWPRGTNSSTRPLTELPLRVFHAGAAQMGPSAMVLFHGGETKDGGRLFSFNVESDINTRPFKPSDMRLMITFPFQASSVSNYTVLD